MKFAINGRFIVRKQTGQERFAQEIVREFEGKDINRIRQNRDMILLEGIW